MAEENDETMDDLGFSSYKFFTPENGAILLANEITPESTARVVDELLFADAEGVDDIILFINSPGGDAYGTIMILDTIQMIKTPVTGIVSGIAASGAFYALEACDRRIMTKHSYLFWHQLITSPGDISNKVEMSNVVKRYEKLNEKFEEFLRDRAKISVTNWKKHFQSDNDIYFDATEALNLNLIDEVMALTKNPKKYAKVEKK